MYGLEYALFFGVPCNKLELIEGTSRWSFPFESREFAEAHFHAWLDTLCRWKQVDATPPIRKSHTSWNAYVGGVQLELFPRPISIHIPIAHKAFDAFLETFNRRDFWPGQPCGLESGWDSPLDDGDIRLNVWKLLHDLSKRHGGQSSGRVDIALSDSATVAPDVYYYRPGRKNVMIERDYFCAAPDLIAEVLFAPSRSLDRGERMEVYRRAGVPNLWLLEPALETIEVYELAGQYEPLGEYRLSESFSTRIFPGESISVDELFDTQSKRWEGTPSHDPPDPINEWILPPQFLVGLEYFFHLGHPERRWEFWGNKARSVLAFGSPTEARRFDHFLAEACSWEGIPKPKVGVVNADMDQVEVGRFQLTRQGRLVYLDVAVDGRRHLELLRIWGKSEVWDWGEE